MDKVIGRKVFGLRLEEAKIQNKLAVNQGLPALITLVFF